MFFLRLPNIFISIGYFAVCYIQQNNVSSKLEEEAARHRADAERKAREEAADTTAQTADKEAADKKAADKAAAEKAIEDRKSVV